MLLYGLIIPWLSALLVDLSSGLRIVGGQFAEEQQFPYQVALFKNGNFSCGGSIVGTRWILTAAHCLHGVEDTLSVLAGTAHLTRGGHYYKPEKFFPFSEEQSLKDDIALIKLKDAIVFDETMQPIELFTDQLEAGSKVVISGHGKTGNDEPHSELLKYNTMKMVESESCRNSTGAASDSNICFNNVIDNGICFGDSGGPAVFEGKQVGVASYTVGSCGSKLPDVYCHIRHYAEWITSTIDRN